MDKISLNSKYQEIVSKISDLVDQGYRLHSNDIVLLSEQLDKIVLQLQREKKNEK